MAMSVKPQYVGGQKAISSEYLGETLKLYDERREGKLHDALFEEVPEVPAIPEHYELAEMQDGTTKNSLKIVADGSLTDGSTEVEKATVNAKLLDGEAHTFAVGEYVILVAEVPLVPATEKEIYLRAEDFTIEVEEDLLDLEELFK